MGLTSWNGASRERCLRIPFTEVGLRFSPDATRYHIDAVRETWIKWGGSDRYQIAGE
jgi:hypothetical protein